MVFKTTAIDHSAISPARGILAYPSRVRGHGVFRVGRGGNPAARALASMMGLPRAGEAVETRLAVTPCRGGVLWQRTFDGRPMNSRQYPDSRGGFAERFGVVEIRFARDVAAAATVFRQTGASLVAGSIRLPLPRACAPRIRAREDIVGPGQRRIDVRIDAPLVGLLLTYAGTIDIDEAAT